MPKRLAITIAGAVSLGSYEAGVLYEVLDAVHQHNNNSATAASDRIVIDVLTGASAGGMTAIILAQKLMYGAGEFVGPYDNPLYNIWVKRISLEELQKPEDSEPALHSLFSSTLIETISKEALLARYEGELSPKERHSGVGDFIRVGVALTNLNGIAYGYDVTPGGRFTYIDYGDQLSREVVDAMSDTSDFWEPLRQAAVACGAFPVAFRPQDVSRSAKIESNDYPSPNLEKWAQDPQLYTYSDGGILQNQPLGMAKNLVDLIDCHQNQDSRYYLFVSPHAKDPDTSDTFHARNADYFHLLMRLVSVAIGQSGFQDWITAKDVNTRLALLDERAKGLRDAILNHQIDVPALMLTSNSVLLLFFPHGTHRAPGARKDESLLDAKDRIQKQYHDWVNDLAGIPGASDAFRDAVLAFETSAGLGACCFPTLERAKQKIEPGLKAGLGRNTRFRARLQQVPQHIC
ncbi:patatin-like phospholipase family protein [Granulicella sp. WH15]|uniref:patatin-like phospholipase family protein n=1 Tax=Granulicella sp. WH15 TaxID=2602070 RepID=UPI001366D1D3|nr:patatin-like phospholipase family protein [Granulicella sp. WH15]QHN03167.1 patatin-like phospholipase family protein [Granulicella sp. WH15]